jgi:SulP family sulfate permease
VRPTGTSAPAPTDAAKIDAGENPLSSEGNRLTEIPQAICRTSEYGWGRFLGDISGGVIAALISLPYGLAMSSLMGLPPVRGVFTSMLTAPVIAALGRNPLLIGGTSIVTVPFIAMAVRAQGLGGAAEISIAASIIMIGFCVLRLGRYVTHVPHAVISGFSCGMGAMMLISQLNTILGLDPAVARNADSTAAQLFAVIQQIGAARANPLLLGIAVIATATIAARWSQRIPAPLLGVAAAIAIARAVGIHEREIGSLPAVLPPFVGFSFSLGDGLTVLPSAFGLALVSSFNILMTSRVVEHCRGRGQRMSALDADVELGAYGIANLFAGMFGAPLSVGTPARSLAVVRCGGTTCLANLLHGIILAAILWLGSGALSHIPTPALAGVTAWMGLSLVDWGIWRRLLKMNLADAYAYVATATSVLFVNASLSVVVGCSIYVFRLAYQETGMRSES